MLSFLKKVFLATLLVLVLASLLALNPYAGMVSTAHASSGKVIVVNRVAL